MSETFDSSKITLKQLILEQINGILHTSRMVAGLTMLQNSTEVHSKVEDIKNSLNIQLNFLMALIPESLKTKKFEQNIIEINNKQGDSEIVSLSFLVEIFAETIALLSKSNILRLEFDSRAVYLDETQIEEENADN